MTEIRKDGYYVELLLFVVLLFNMFFPVVPQLILFPVALCFAIQRLGKAGLAFCCLLFLGDVAHAYCFLLFHIPKMSFLTILVGFFLMKDFLIKNKTVLLKNSKILLFVVLYLLIMMILFGNVFHSPKKLGTLFINSITSYIAFSYIIAKRKQVNLYRLVLYSAIFAICLIQLNIVCNHYLPPTSPLDFGFYREQLGTDMYEDLADSGILYATHYQFFGFMVCMPLSILFASEKLSKFKFLLIFLIIVIVVGYTGARQYLAILALLFMMNLLIYDYGLFFRISIMGLAFVTASIIIFSSAMADFFTVMEERGLMEGTGRLVTLEAAYKLFSQSPVFGVGYLGYNYYGDYDVYPHNILIEMLCELGIAGTVIVWLNSFLICGRNIRNLFNREYSVYGIFLLVCLFGRAMVSGSVSQNIILWGAWSALSFYNYTCINNKLYKSN